MFDPQTFWRNPEASTETSSPLVIAICKPEFYLSLHKVTALVVDTLSRYADKAYSILEIGCGTGRNLVGLQESGFYNLHGIEISPRAIKVGASRFPEYASMDIVCGPVEDWINDIEPVDVIFTQGCFMHLPPSSEWVFGVVAKKATKLIMTIENEIWPSERAWARNYKQVFGELGWRCVKELSCGLIPPLPHATIMRVFVPESGLE